MPRFRRVAVALCALLAACSSGGTDVVAKDPEGAVLAAVRRTTDEKTVKIDFAATLGAGGVEVATGVGAFDFARDRGRFTLESPIGGNADMVVTTDKAYLKRPESSGGEKRWVYFTDDQIAAGGDDVGFLSYLRSQIDPRQTLRNLGSTYKKVKVVGKENVRGAATTHLSGQLEPPDTAGYPLDLWLDHDGRVRRLQYAVGVGTGAAQSQTIIRMDLFDFGEDPKIVVPSDSESEPAPA